MEPNDKKLKFIVLRAENQPYSYIAKELEISKSTCTAWNRELANEIKTMREERLSELYTAYSMTKEARIKGLGEALKKIDEALQEVDYSEMDPAKLLALRLKYAEALQREHVELNMDDTSPFADLMFL